MRHVVPRRPEAESSNAKCSEPCDPLQRKKCAGLCQRKPGDCEMTGCKARPAWVPGEIRGCWRGSP
ncbi:hypothetical protein SZ55_2086 [Pseudomonas sp. FeS53a]|nr:hypothetical protein SZ55_2086 [Pseudomonas sp. FeS53a]